MTTLRRFIVFISLAALLCSCAAPVASTGPVTPDQTLTPAGQVAGMTEGEFEALLPQDIDYQLSMCWQSISNGKMGAPAEAEWVEILACADGDLSSATFSPPEGGVSADTAKYEVMAAVPMLGLTLVTPIPGDEFVVLGYMVYQGVKFALIAVTAYGATYLTAETILLLFGAHSNPQHDMSHTTARTYANIVNANLTGPNGPAPDVKCAIILMIDGAVRYAAMVPTHTFSGKAILAWWQNSSWGGAYRIRVSEFPETLTRGVDSITAVACNQLPPPPGVLTP